MSRSNLSINLVINQLVINQFTIQLIESVIFRHSRFFNQGINYIRYLKHYPDCV